MFYVDYEIEFFSPWHCGSGQGGGNDADFCPIRDTEGFPFVPGKTLKGLFRDAAETLCGYDFTARIFGVASKKDGSDAQTGQAIWSDACLSAATRNQILQENLQNELYINQYFIKLNEQGQTEDGALRRGEYTVPVKLHGRIENLNEDDIGKIRDCAGFIKHLGLQRSRGFGRCRITVTGSGAAAAAGISTAFKRKDIYHFKCKFLAPVVLNTTGATEGNLDTLEYIPGANFLGIIGRDYKAFGDQAFDVFHAGKVRFSNAYPLENGKNMALPCPATWFIPKGESLTAGTEIFFDSAGRSAKQKVCQPKQVRGGYFIPAAEPRVFGGKISKNFSLKSAYDSEKRKTRDGEMFGYTALNEGTEWAFNVKIDPAVSDDTAEKIVMMLQGRHQIGRSRNSQYGSVMIKLLEADPLQDLRQKQTAQLHYFYAASSLAFLDAYGNPAVLPDPADLGFGDDAKLDMAETQIRTHAYCPWNGARKSRDAERLVILPGSVIVVRSEKEPDPDVWKNGVGIYKSEGFGDIIYNPGFLFCGKLSPAEKTKNLADSAESGTLDKILITWLNDQKTKKNEVCDIYSSVREFIRDHGNEYVRVSASQWGAVRAKVANAENVQDLCSKLFETEPQKDEQPSYEDAIKNGRKVHFDHPGYLRHGTAVKQWNESAVDFLQDTIRELKNKNSEYFTLTFMQLLCAEMAKKASKKGGRK